MKIIVFDNHEKLSLAAAQIMAAVFNGKPDASVLLATGNTPVGAYRELRSMRSQGEVDTGRLRVFQLDEYCDLGPGDDRSLFGWLEREFLSPLQIAAQQVVRFTGDADTLVAVAAYESAVVAAGGIDLSVLGLGPNGHLGFNEPPSDATSPTREITLTLQSVQSNGHYWGGEERVPRRALTAGMDVILGASQTLLLVSGAHKADILKRTIEGEVTEDVPASYLQQCDNVVVLADRQAWPEGSSTI